MRTAGSIFAHVSCFAIVGASPLVAQLSVASAVEAKGTPGGAGILLLRAGTTVARVVTKGGDVLVTVEGWVDASKLAGRRDTFALSVGGKTLLRLRATPSLQGAILADLRPGTGLVSLGKQGSWAHVKRSGWIPSSALSASSGGAGVAPAASAPAEPAAPAGAMSAARATKVLASPGGRAVGEIVTGTVVQPLARDRGWVRVRIDGWVPERDLSPTDSAFGAGITAADLRSDPEGMRGKVVRWEVQVLSLQVADPLRRELARDEPYLIARGPGAENALLYLAVPPSLLVEAKAIPPLTTVLITARVRVGRSEPVGTPILDLKSVSRR